jgi:hypothetical protein
VTINGIPVQMELDTGAAYSVITQTTYQRIAQQKSINSLEPSDLRLTSYSGDSIGKSQWWFVMVSRNVSYMCKLWGQI